MVRLYLFGAPRLEQHGLPVALRRTKALALLAYLAVTGQPHGRETVLALLWPEFDDASARNNLRRELSLLRSTLGDDLLATDRRQIAWGAPEQLWVDVEAFRAHLAAAQQLPPATAEWAAALEAAVALAEAEFLAGFSLPDSAPFEEWQFFQRESLRQQLAEALAALVDWQRAAANYSAAIAYARRWLALDQLHEPAQRALIALYALDGRHAAALRQYEVCVQLLAHELGVAPEPETQALLAAVKERRLAPASAPMPVVPALPPATPQPVVDLPAPVSGFVGRERELALVLGLLRDPDCRLLTLTGPGGVGKTQLALHAAQRLCAGEPAAPFADGIVFVPLAPIATVEMVLPAIVQALKIGEQAEQSPLQTLSAFLRERRCLLILDNLEQVIGVAPKLAALLASAPQLTLLITSREALQVRDEQVVPVAPLAVPQEADPSDAQAVGEPEAVQLFVRRAQQIRPDFALTAANRAAVGAICRRLDGLPLAIELAAARMRMFSPQALSERLEHCLPLLSSHGRDGTERHRTLRNAIAWSYDLLDPAEQRLFRQLAVFVGGVTLEAIAAICLETEPADAYAALDLVEALLARSLLIQDEQAGEPRFSMLATIREYAEELLQHDAEQPALEARHAAYYAAWIEQASAELFRAEQRLWRLRMLHEYPNVRAVLQRARRNEDAELLLRVAGKLGRFWGLQGNLREGRAWLETALAAGEAADAALRARAQLSLGNVCWMQSDLAAAEQAFGASLALYQELGEPYGTAQALNGLGITLLEGAHYVQARPYFAASLALFRGLGDQERIATLLNNYAITVEGVGDWAQARQAFAESMALQQALGNDVGYALALNNLARIDFEEGRQAAAYEAFGQSAAMNRKLGNAVILSSALLYLGRIAAEQGDYAGAQAHLHEALQLGRQVDSAKAIVDTLEGWAFLAFQADRPLAAVQFFATAMRMREQSRYFQEADGTALAATREYLQCVLAPDAWAGAWQRGWHTDLDALVQELQTALDDRSRRSAHVDQEQIERAGRPGAADQRPREPRTESVVRQAAQADVQPQVDEEKPVQRHDQRLVLPVRARANQRGEQERIERHVQGREHTITPV
jgi:predicted ATPase/DNA-binding SARP family transcriptional activator